MAKKQSNISPGRPASQQWQSQSQAQAGSRCTETSGWSTTPTTLEHCPLLNQGLGLFLSPSHWKDPKQLFVKNLLDQMDFWGGCRVDIVSLGRNWCRSECSRSYSLPPPLIHRVFSELWTYSHFHFYPNSTDEGTPQNLCSSDFDPRSTGFCDSHSRDDANYSEDVSDLKSGFCVLFCC